jgi:hypothetical protein
MPSLVSRSPQFAVHTLLLSLLLSGCNEDGPAKDGSDAYQYKAPSICEATAPDGAAWHQIAAESSWAPRDSHAVYSIGDGIVVYGGWSDSTAQSPRDMWASSDGVFWTHISDEAASSYSDLAPVAYAFGRYWMTTGWKNGRLEDGGAGREIWSSKDGLSWSLIREAPPFSARVGAALVAFKGQLWMFGGTADYYSEDMTSLKNAVWTSSNGITWRRVLATAPWAPRTFFNAAVLGDKLYLVGGGNYLPQTFGYSDVWSTEDGVNWTQETADGGWVPRIWSTLVAFRGALWLMGGWTGENTQDVWWSKDGKTWTQMPNAPWSRRHATAATVFNDQIMLLGGNSDGVLTSDVWGLTLPGDSKPECGPGY